MNDWLANFTFFDDYSPEQIVTKVLMSLFVLFLALTINKTINSLLQRQAEKSLDKTIVPMLCSVVTAFIYAIAISIILENFGVSANSIIAMLGAAGLAIGLALKDTLSNIAAGIMLIALRPIRIDDYIECSSVSGTVKSIGLFSTELQTPDGIFISAPNTAIWHSPIKNFSRNSKRRMDIVVGIDYSDSIDTAIEVLTKLAQEESRVLETPAPNFFVQSMGDSSVNITFRVWVNRPDYWSVLHAMNKAIKEHIEAAGLTIPFPQRSITFQNKIAIEDKPLEDKPLDNQ